MKTLPHKTVKVETPMLCPYCGKDAEWVSNEVIYGRRFGRSWMVYLCRPCDAYVGCHNNTRKPLGTMAKKSLRIARGIAHAIVDPLWNMNADMTRGEVYAALSSVMGHPVHIGATKSVEECEQIVAVAKAIWQEQEGRIENNP